MSVLRCTSTGGSVVEISPATREARVRFPASANFLHATILVSFPINRTKRLWSIACPSWLSFLSSWKKCYFPQDEILVDINFGKKHTRILHHFVPCVRLLLCLAEVFGCCSVKFMKENGCLFSPVRPRCDKRTYCSLFFEQDTAHQLVNMVLNQFADRFSDYAHQRGKKVKET